MPGSDGYDAPVTSPAPTHPGTDRPAFNLAVIGGDGIGPEVVAEGLKVLDAVTGPGSFAVTSYDLGAERWKRTGEVLPESVVNELDGADAILFCHEATAAEEALLAVMHELQAAGIEKPYAIAAT